MALFLIAVLTGLSSSQVSPSFKLEKSMKIYDTKIDENFDLLDRFLEGLRATVFSPNAIRCSLRTRYTALDFNRTFI